MTAAVQQMASTARTWHGLENLIDEGASREEWIEAAGFGFNLHKGLVRYATERDQSPAEYQFFREKAVIFRDDNLEPMGVVGAKFQITQPREVAAFMFDVAEQLGAKMSTMGVLFSGQRYWALLHLEGMTGEVGKGDFIKKHLLFCTACDGSLSNEIRECDERVVCNNTLQVARGEKGGKIYKVTHKSKFNADAAKKALDLEHSASRFEAACQEMQRMAETRLTDAQMLGLTADLLKPDWRDLDEEDRKRLFGRANSPLTLIGRKAVNGTEYGADLEGGRGTAYGWLNAVTEYYDHDASREVSTRMNNALFGSAVQIKSRAYGMALDTANHVAPTTDGGGLLASLLDRPVSAGVGEERIY